jgi:hypothetical protein
MNSELLSDRIKSRYKGSKQFITTLDKFEEEEEVKNEEEKNDEKNEKNNGIVYTILNFFWKS